MRKNQSAKPKPKATPALTGLTREAIKEINDQHFKDRYARVCAVMEEEGIGFAATPLITPDGTIGVKIHPYDSRLVKAIHPNLP